MLGPRFDDAMLARIGCFHGRSAGRLIRRRECHIQDQGTKIAWRTKMEVRLAARGYPHRARCSDKGWSRDALTPTPGVCYHCDMKCYFGDTSGTRFPLGTSAASDGSPGIPGTQLREKALCRGDVNEQGRACLFLLSGEPGSARRGRAPAGRRPAGRGLVGGAGGGNWTRVIGG